MSVPWNEKTAPDRVRPRECVGEARDALNRAYSHRERAQVPLLIEAVDWLRRALEQMVPTTDDCASSRHQDVPVEREPLTTEEGLS